MLNVLSSLLKPRLLVCVGYTHRTTFGSHQLVPKTFWDDSNMATCWQHWIGHLRI